ncbi:hypothetical protein ACWGK7_01195 [Sphingomonas aurantiaca]
MANAPTPADPQPPRAQTEPPIPAPPPPPTLQPAPPPTPPRAPERPIPDHVAEEVRHVLAWMAHVDAGRIGHRIPVSPEIAANRDSSTALFRRLRK